MDGGANVSFFTSLYYVIINLFNNKEKKRFLTHGRVGRIYYLRRIENEQTLSLQTYAHPG